MIKQIIDFKQVESEILAADLKIVYKYRDWDNDKHKKIINNKEIWFSHPLQLNDPYDMRPPYDFDTSTIDWTKVRGRMRNAGRAQEPYLTPEELEIEVDKRIDQFKKDPVGYFQLNRANYIADASHYDRLGVFSTCLTGDNTAMWAYYGANHAGFAIGFYTAELVKALQCTIGKVVYDDTPVKYYIMGNNEGTFMKEIFQKSKQWAAEDEVRFLTAGIGSYKKRNEQFPITAVAEVVLGLQTTAEVQDKIMEACKVHLPGIPVYKLEKKNNTFGLKKKNIL